MLPRAAVLSIAIVGLLVLGSLTAATSGTAATRAGSAGATVARIGAGPSPARAGPGGALDLAQAEIHPDAAGYVFILPNGSLAGVPAPPIAIDGSTYDLTADFSGAIVDERNASVFDGGGFTLTTSPALGFGFQVNTTINVSVQDLEIGGGGRGVEVVNSSDVAVDGSTVAPAGVGFLALESNDVEFDSDAANGSDFGFAANSSGTVTFADDYANTATVGYFADASDGVSARSVVGTGDRFGLEAVFAQGVAVAGGDFRSAVDFGVALLYDSNVDLTDLQANSSDFGLVGEFGQALTVEDSNFTAAASAGAELELYDAVTLEDDNFSSAGQDGLVVDHGSSDNLSYDDANDSALTGFELGNLSDSSLFDDRASANGFNGLELDDSDGLRVTGSAFDDSPDGNGTFVRVSSSVTFVGDSWAGDEDGLFDVSSHALTVAASNASNDSVAGFLFYDDAASNVTDSVADNDSSAGFVLEATVDASLVGDALSGDGDGVALVSTVNSYLADDVATAISGDAYFALADADSVLTADRATNVGYGFYSGGASGTTFADDQVTNATDAGAVFELDTGVSFENGNVSDSAIGFVLGGGTDTNVSGNWFGDDADDFEISLDDAHGATVYWNDFVGGGGWIFDPTGGTVGSIAFDAGYPGGGNYWSNWTSPDVEHGPDQNLPGGDGIVDDPLVISGAYVDQYPLTRPLDLANLTLTFLAIGLPAGTAWGVDVAGVGSETTTTGSIGVWLGAAAWANYSYSVSAPAGWTALPAAGTIAYTAGLETVVIEFRAVTYNATFSATGLPSGTSWSVNVSGTLYSGTGSSITVPLANGTYGYTVSAVNGYSRSPASGTLTIQESTPQVAIAFQAYTYSVTFSQVGLSNGTGWSVTFGGTTLTSTTPTITFVVANGTYVYRIGNVSGFSVVPGSGVQIVAGPGASVTVAYRATPSSTSNLLLWVLVALVVILAALVVVLLVRGRAKPSSAPGVAGWTPPSGASGSAPAPTPEAPAPPTPVPTAPPSPPPPDWKET